MDKHLLFPPQQLMGTRTQLERIGQARVVQTRQPMEDPRPVHAALGHQEMEVRVEVDPIPESLDGDNDTGDEIFARHGLKIDRKGFDGASAELTEEPAPELEEYPQRLGNRENNLAMSDIQEQRLPHPLAPRLQALGLTRRAETPRLAGERQQAFRSTVRASDPGEARAGVAAVEVAPDDLFNISVLGRPACTIRWLLSDLWIYAFSRESSSCRLHIWNGSCLRAEERIRYLRGNE
jgi:hypothetical protein